MLSINTRTPLSSPIIKIKVTHVHSFCNTKHCIHDVVFTIINATTMPTLLYETQ
jgi:hypothetical protein